MSKDIVTIDRDKTINKENRAMWIGIALVTIFALTNGANVSINTIFVAVSYICILGLPLGFSVAALAGVAIYFGWTYIGIQTTIPIIQSWYSYQVGFYLLFAIKIFLTSKGDFLRRVGKPMLALIAFVFIAYASISIVSAIRETAMLIVVAWMLYNLIEENQYRDIFMKAFIIILLTVFVYNAMYNIVEDSNPLRYAGVRDPNNFAFWCNMAIAFLLIFNIFNGNKLMLCAFVVGGVLTISVSGILIMLAIITVYYLFRKSAFHAFMFIIIVAIIALMFGPVVNFIANLNVQSLQGYVRRLTEITAQLKMGDYDVATTDRTLLWEIYMGLYEKLSVIEKLAGSPYTLSEIRGSQEILSSHNSAIDIVFNYGLIGLVLIVINLLNINLRYLKSGKIYMVALSIIFIVNAFFRSFSGFSLFFPMFL